MKKIYILLFVASLLSCQNETKKTTEEVLKTENKSTFDSKPYKLKGKEIAMGTFKVFKGKIESVGKTKGLPEVVNFCNAKARTLTDSIGKANHVLIQRTSNRLRNDKNKANADQQAVINNYLEAQERRDELKPLVMKDDEGFVHFYAPIKLKKKCLQCHGKPNVEISEQVLAVIKKKYPSDKATGFSEGELRGIWDIKFLDKQ